MPLTSPSSPANPYILPGQSLVMFGFNPVINMNSTPEDIWTQGDLIPFPVSQTVVTIVSDSADDTGAGTGANAVVLVGVNDIFDEIIEVVVMNGLTPVVSVAEFLFINAAVVAAAGNTGVNQGLITFTIDGNLCNTIVGATGQSQTAAAVIPKERIAGTSAHLIHGNATVGKTPSVQGTFVLNRRGPNQGVIRESINVPLTSDGGPFNLPVTVPINFLAGEEVVARITSSSANGMLASAFFQFSWLPLPE